MNNTTFQELKSRIRISDVAEHIGYRLNTGAGKNTLSIGCIMAQLKSMKSLYILRHIHRLSSAGTDTVTREML